MRSSQSDRKLTCHHAADVDEAIVETLLLLLYILGKPDKGPPSMSMTSDPRVVARLAQDA